jgi:hypothetical protein
MAKISSADPNHNNTETNWESCDTARSLQGLEARMANWFEAIERQLGRSEDRQRNDFLFLLVVVLAGFAGLIGVMARGFHWI